MIIALFVFYFIVWLTATLCKMKTKRKNLSFSSCASGVSGEYLEQWLKPALRAKGWLSRYLEPANFMSTAWTCWKALNRNRDFVLKGQAVLTLWAQQPFTVRALSTQTDNRLKDTLQTFNQLDILYVHMLSIQKQTRYCANTTTVLQACSL